MRYIMCRTVTPQPDLRLAEKEPRAPPPPPPRGAGRSLPKMQRAAPPSPPPPPPRSAQGLHLLLPLAGRAVRQLTA